MKKQLLIMILAIFAIGVTNSFGQLVPRAITCLPGDALHPIAGTPYDYTISVPTPTGGTNTILWMATQDQQFIQNKLLIAAPEIVGVSTILADASATYNLATLAPGGLTVQLTWNSFTYDPLNPVFVIVQVVNDNGTCTPNNLKVYKIQPINAFTLDIENITASGALSSGYGTNIDRCISDILDAQYDATLDAVVTDFGADTLLYQVVAANWSDAWNLEVQLTGINALEHVTVEWATDAAFTTINTMAGALVGTGATPTVYTTGTNVTPNVGTTIGADGESIFIRVILDHSDMLVAGWEGLTNQVINLAVDGTTMLAAAIPVGDVHYNNGTVTPPDPCPPLVVDGFTNDLAIQTLLARPDINATTPTPFLPTAP